MPTAQLRSLAVALVCGAFVGGAFVAGAVAYVLTVPKD